MPDERTQPTPPPTPVQKTAAVPLKKETVRITLRARPGAGVTQPKEQTAPVATAGTASVPRAITTSVTPAGAATARVPTSPVTLGGATPSKATAPIQLPSAPLPPPAVRVATTQVTLPPGPGAPPAPTVAAPRPVARPAGPPAAPQRPGGAPPPPGMAPTIPMAKLPPGSRPPGAPTAAAPKPPAATQVETGARTVPLAKGPGGGAPKPPGVSTAPMAKPGPTPGPTQQLPKATQQLKQGATIPMAKSPMGTPPSAPAKQRPSAPDEYEEPRDPDAGLAPLAVVCMFLALALMAVNLLGTDRTFPVEEGTESPFLVPSPSTPNWEQKQPDGSYKSSFSTKLGAVTKNLE